MGYIKKLTDNKGNVIYPISVLAAIYKDDNQTTEEWLQSIIDQLKEQTSSAVEGLDTALQDFDKESQERIDHYNSMADEALAQATTDLDAVVEDVQASADTRKQAINDLADQKETEIAETATERNQGISDLADTKESEITELAETKEGEITELADTEKSAVTSHSELKQSEIDKLADALKQRLRDAETFIDEAHITSKVAREEGIHGIRIFGDKLSYKNDMEEWEDVEFGGIVISDVEPSNQGALWMDSSSGRNVAKYYNGEAWVLLPVVWG